MKYKIRFLHFWHFTNVLLACFLSWGCGNESVNYDVSKVENADSTHKVKFSITGRAFEANSKTPLAGAVILVNNSKGIQIPRHDRSITETDGSFMIEGLSEGPYRLRANYRFEFTEASVESELLSREIFIDEEGEFVDLYFSVSEAHSRLDAQMAIPKPRTENEAIVSWYQTLEKQPKDLVPKGFIVNDAHQLMFWSYQVHLKN